MCCVHKYMCSPSPPLQCGSDIRQCIISKLAVAKQKNKRRYANWGPASGKNMLARKLYSLNEFPRNLVQPYRRKRLRGRFGEKLVSRAGWLDLQSGSPKPVREFVLGLPLVTKNGTTAAQATKTSTATTTTATAATKATATLKTATLKVKKKHSIGRTGNSDIQNKNKQKRT